MNTLNTPLKDEDICRLSVGDNIAISGNILCGRDMVLPLIVKYLYNGDDNDIKNCLQGGLIFHTAVSSAGIGPTSSNKTEIESSMIPLSEAGVRIHLGKGKISKNTIEGLAAYGSAYAIIPPVSALLSEKVIDKKVLAHPELGMEALYSLTVRDFPIIIAAVNGRSIYEKC